MYCEAHEIFCIMHEAISFYHQYLTPIPIFISPRRYMFWSDHGVEPKIERAYMDGTHRNVIYRGGRANGLTIDYLERRLYWTSLDTNSIESADLFGTLFDSPILDSSSSTPKTCD